MEVHPVVQSWCQHSFCHLFLGGLDFILSERINTRKYFGKTYTPSLLKPSGTEALAFILRVFPYFYFGETSVTPLIPIPIEFGCNSSVHSKEPSSGRWGCFITLTGLRGGCRNQRGDDPAHDKSDSISKKSLEKNGCHSITEGYGYSDAYFLPLNPNISMQAIFDEATRITCFIIT